MSKILIIGANGFIGHHLIPKLTKHQLSLVDLNFFRLEEINYCEKIKIDITDNDSWAQRQLEALIKFSDIVIPLAAIATPMTYVEDPLKVFELDFKANLRIVEQCAKFEKRIIFPSTSEVYGMCDDAQFNTETSNFVLGPINKPRWIYSCAKQLLDRVLHAYGMKRNFNYTIFRPFNWIGTGQDNFESTSSRVCSRFAGNIFREEPLELVDGGMQRRCFLDIEDGVDALVKIIDDELALTNKKIFNIGNPDADYTIEDIAKKMIQLSGSKSKLKNKSSQDFYGKGYQDVLHRVPDISKTKLHLQWSPKIPIDETLTNILRQAGVMK